MPSKRLTTATFNRQSIDTWHDDVTSLPGKISQQRADLEAVQRQLADHQHELQSFQTTEIEPLEIKQRGLTARIRVLTIPGILEPKKVLRQQESEKRPPLNDKVNATQNRLTLQEKEVTAIKYKIEIDASMRKISDLSQKLIAIRQQKLVAEQQLNEKRSELSHIGAELEEKRAGLRSLRRDQFIDNIGHLAHETHHHGHHHAHHHGHHHHNRLAEVIHTVGDISRDYSISDLESEISRMDARYRMFSTEISRLSSSIVSYGDEERCALNEQASLQSRIRFLTPLASLAYQSPADLMREKIKRDSILAEHQVLTNQLLQLDQTISTLDSEIRTLTTELNTATTESVAFKQNMDKENLQGLLRDTQASLNPLIARAATKKDEITRIAGRVVVLTQLIGENQSRYDKLIGNQWLRQLHENPSNLVSDLSAKLQSIYARYRELPNLSPAMQLFLVELDNKLNIILNIQQPTTPAVSREIYCQMIGMVWGLLDKLPESIVLDSPIIKEIYACLEQHPLYAEDAINAYRQLCSLHPNELKDMQPNELVNLRYKEYDMALSRLKSSLDAIPEEAAKVWLDVYDSGYDVLKAIDKYRSQKTQGDESLSNLRFAILVINKTQQLVNQPNNSQYQKEYRDLMSSNRDGKPSLWKKVLGAMLLFIGAITAIASVGLLFGTWGIASPFSVAGIAAGSACVVAGIGLFAHGMKKGVEKKMDNFDQAVGKLMGSSNPRSLFNQPVVGVVFEPAPAPQKI